MTDKKLNAIIMAGGSGTRFWPLSRRSRPKQLLSLFGPQTMLTQTAERIRPLTGDDGVMVVTGAHLVEGVAGALPQLPAANIIAEPVGRNTAPCIGLATALIQHRAAPGQDPIVGVFAADHHVAKPQAFRDAIQKAIAAADAPKTIVTLGITPTRPETGYGYIKCHADQTPTGAYGVERFVEKPDLDTAERYLSEGGYLWNAGLFFFRASTMMAEIERQLPRMAALLKEIAASFDDPDGGKATIDRLFPKMESISIDYGVMEGAQSVQVVPTDAGWSDVGHWAALPSLLDTDEDGNVIRGDVIHIDTQQSVAFNDRPDHVLALVGVEGVTVVTTPDATLVIPTDQAQKVRQIVAQLKDHQR